jgi:hypothetical protein
MIFYVRFLVLAGLVAGTVNSAFAQQLNCGAPPQLDQRLQNDETIKGTLQGKAQALSKLVGSADLGGQIEATKKEIYVQSKDFYPAQQEAYLNYLFCSIISADTKLSTLERLDALAKIRAPRPPIPKTCQNPAFGIAGWANQETLQGTSGWRGGGYNPGAYCTDFTNSVIASRGLGNQPHVVDNLKPGEEQRRTGFLNSVAEYNYHCSITLRWNPIYNQRADPLCGME